MSLELRSNVGGGLKGQALAQLVDSTLESAIKHTDAKLRAQLENYYHARSGTSVGAHLNRHKDRYQIHERQSDDWRRSPTWATQ
ncbi:hypothetical protein BI330_06020 [Mycobacterium sp. CBMA 623]|nr:hypothetical protein [Mycobacteroides sp. CBMA 326]